MKSDQRFIEQIKYFFPNLFTKKTIKVLAYCIECLENKLEVPLESRLTELGRETKKFKTQHDTIQKMRYQYEHIIDCREGHEIYKANYWTPWEEVFPLPPVPC